MQSVLCCFPMYPMYSINVEVRCFYFILFFLQSAVQRTFDILFLLMANSSHASMHFCLLQFPSLNTAQSAGIPLPGRDPFPTCFPSVQSSLTLPVPTHPNISPTSCSQIESSALTQFPHLSSTSPIPSQCPVPPFAAPVFSTPLPTIHQYQQAYSVAQQPTVNSMATLSQHSHSQATPSPNPTSMCVGARPQNKLSLYR